ncbi:hypothetical protein ASU31_00075 [Pedobacter ginsenosidimutans]|uniref:Uncharacterized protein n=1 Tax=Pedobacter ginsenosidimutans TaxID=687842 RepID=A0A0T5VV91_9SPHI|nr:hypothetical protein [Pedobacter ginsenosidimutans]KRT17730.1 hypothetical protein ASU31_00075 [Pedobacter ginsenosidimutans]
MEELSGKLVAINPLLTNDPSFRQGQIGIIAMADLKFDTVSIGFSSGEMGKYSTDAVLVLKDKRDLYHDIMTGVGDMDRNTFKQLLDINMKQEHADYGHQSSAMKIALSNPEMLKRSTISLAEYLSINQVNDISHETAFKR